MLNLNKDGHCGLLSFSAAFVFLSLAGFGIGAMYYHSADNSKPVLLPKAFILGSTSLPKDNLRLQESEDLFCLQHTDMFVRRNFSRRTSQSWLHSEEILRFGPPINPQRSGNFSRLLVVLYAGNLRTFENLADKHRALLQGLAQTNEVVVSMHTWSTLTHADPTWWGQKRPPTNSSSGSTDVFRSLLKVFGSMKIPTLVRIEDHNFVVNIQKRLPKYSRSPIAHLVPTLQYAICNAFSDVDQDHFRQHSVPLPDNTPLVRMRPDAYFSPDISRKLVSLALRVSRTPTTVFAVYPLKFFLPIMRPAVLSDSFFITSAVVMRELCSLDIEKYVRSVVSAFAAKPNNQQYQQRAGRVEEIFYSMFRAAGATQVYMLRGADLVLQRQSGELCNYNSSSYCPPYSAALPLS